MTIVDAQTNQSIGTGEGGQTGEMTTADELIAGHTDAAVNRYKTFDAFVAGHKELESKLGTAIQSLPDNPTDEQIKAFRAKVGCPETVEGYVITKPTLPEGMQFDDELVKSAARFAYDNHIPKGVFEGLVSLVVDGQVGTFKQALETAAKAEGETQQAEQKTKDQSIETAENKLKGEWGVDYDKNLEMANRFYDLPGNDEVNKAFTDLLAEKGLSSNPVVVKFFREAYKLVKEDEIPEGGTGAGKANEAGQLSYPSSPNMQK